MANTVEVFPRMCPITPPCMRFMQEGKCIHTTDEFEELVRKRTALMVQRERRQVKTEERNVERLNRALVVEKEFPQWQSAAWSEWRKAKIPHKLVVYAFVDKNGRVFLIGDVSDLWKRLFSWSKDDSWVPKAVETVWWLQTFYTKEIIGDLRKAFGWGPTELKDVLRVALWDLDRAHEGCKKHPLWKPREKPLEPLNFWLD
jgi:hypothetical protein